MMQSRLLTADDCLPLVLEPGSGCDGSVDALASFCRSRRTWLDERLCSHGALLFRGFALCDAGRFKTIAETLTDGLKPYVGGDSPRSRVLRHVYTSTEFPADLQIELHNELSYTNTWPSRLLFFCELPPSTGGETPIADSRKIYARIPARICRRFEEKGVAYTQTLRDESVSGPGKSWQDTFETDQRSVVDERCRAGNVEWCWTDYGLRTTTRCRGVLEHPVTGERVWFNQADQWHAGMTSAKYPWGPAAGVSAEPPCHATYGDGSEIAVEDLREVRHAYHASEVLFQWRRGDMLVLDNVLAAHGRKPFSGERRILVSMG